jgi:hypothetical protein
VTARATSNPPLRIDVCDYGQAPPSVRRRYERTTARVGEVGIDGVGLLIARSPAARSLRDLASSRRALDSRRLAEASRSSASRLGSSAFSRLATSTARRQRTAVPSSARGAASNQNRAIRESVPTSERQPVTSPRGKNPSSRFVGNATETSVVACPWNAAPVRHPRRRRRRSTGRPAPG